MSDGDETKNGNQGRQIEDVDTAVGDRDAIECRESMVVGG